MKRISNKTCRLFSAACWLLLIAYTFYILYMTLLCRTPRTFYQYNYKLFWSYQYFFDKDHPQERQIILNILFFIPFGFLLSAVLHICHLKSKKYVFIITVLAACLLSAGIEFLQLILKLGFSEFDDVIDNTAGAMIGAWLSLLLQRIINRKVYSQSEVSYATASKEEM